jgi:hypothetical protein
MFSEQGNFKIRILCDVRPCSLVHSYISFRRNSCPLFHKFLKWEALRASSTSVYINQTTRRHIPADRNPQLLYEDSQDTDNASAELITVNAVGRLAAKLLLTQASTYTKFSLLLYVTVNFSSVYPAGIHHRHVILRQQASNCN